MARYRLHCIGASGNSYKLALYMNCAGLDWEPVGVDFAGGQTRDPDWRAGINAMGEVPVLEVDGQLMSQSGAILIWLAETTGHFAPDAGQRYDALRWISCEAPEVAVDCPEIGGLGEAVLADLTEAGVPLTAVRRLAVHRVPHSGKPEELLDAFGISARKIVEAVDDILQAK